MALPRILVIDVAALGYDLVKTCPEPFAALGLNFTPLEPVFPAVTCPAQATLRTGLPPAGHGIIANGLFQRDLGKTFFWEQAASLLPEGRIWDKFRQRGGRVGLLFWQQSMGETADLVLTPAPVHKHEGGMIQDCYARPAGLYRDLCRTIGREFNLFNYWGPLASFKSTRWITAATLAVMARPDAPELLFTYLPHLDYVLQKYGPADQARTMRAAGELAGELKRLMQGAAAAGYEVLIFGDYAIGPAPQAVFPNRELRRAGWFQIRPVGRMTYPDLPASGAFALVDHQVAHVYVRQPRDVGRVRELLAGLPGVAEAALRADRLPHPRSGELVLTAAPEAWFAYPWWDTPREAPDYASHVDIHSKIGFDPCELFWGWPPPSVSRDPGRVRGTHGRPGCPAAMAATLDWPSPPASLLELSAILRQRLEAT